MITEDDYIWQHMTTWDKIKGQSIYLPVALIFGLMICGVLEVLDQPVTKLLMLLFLASFLGAIIMRTTLASKVERLKNEYQKQR